jgi:D-alanyl-D-alanine carboxypeptidase
MARPWWALLLVAALQFETTPTSSAPQHSAIIVDAETGTVLIAVEPNHRWHPASLTKMMTLYLVFEEIEAKRLDLQEPLAVSEQAAAQPATELGAGAGDLLSVEQAIVAVIVRSANDAAVALAERIAGTEAAFAARMTDRAGALGMTRTVFRNASGLPDPDQVTTARDMVLLARGLLRDFPQHYHYFAAGSFAFKGVTLPTVNGILARYPGSDGIKTGFTCDSGYNLVASATRNDRRLIGVLLGAKSLGARSAEMVKLLDAGFETVRSGAASSPQLTIDTLLAENEPDPPATQQLSPRECARGASATSIGSSSAEPDGRMPGWGVILGVFFSQGEANAAIKKARIVLRDAVPAGKSKLVGGKLCGAPGCVRRGGCERCVQTLEGQGPLLPNPESALSQRPECYLALRRRLGSAATERIAFSPGHLATKDTRVAQIPCAAFQDKRGEPELAIPIFQDRHVERSGVARFDRPMIHAGVFRGGKIIRAIVEQPDHKIRFPLPAPLAQVMKLGSPPGDGTHHLLVVERAVRNPVGDLRGLSTDLRRRHHRASRLDG